MKDDRLTEQRILLQEWTLCYTRVRWLAWTRGGETNSCICQREALFFQVELRKSSGGVGGGTRKERDLSGSCVGKEGSGF